MLSKRKHYDAEPENDDLSDGGDIEASDVSPGARGEDPCSACEKLSAETRSLRERVAALEKRTAEWERSGPLDSEADYQDPEAKLLELERRTAFLEKSVGNLMRQMQSLNGERVDWKNRFEELERTRSPIVTNKLNFHTYIGTLPRTDLRTEAASDHAT